MWLILIIDVKDFLLGRTTQRLALGAVSKTVGPEMDVRVRSSLLPLKVNTVMKLTEIAQSKIVEDANLTFRLIAGSD